MRKLITVATVGAAAALALSGCTNGGGSGSSGELTWEDSPLNEYWSAGYNPDESEEERNAKYEKQNQQREEIVAQCMDDEGFDYVPNVQNSGVVFAGPSEEIKWEPDKKEWVEKYGYGMVNSPYTEFYNNQPQPEPSEYVDPNQKIVEGLSESEQTAYYETLYGKMDEAMTDSSSGEEQEYVYDWKKAGCMGKADHEVSGGQEDVWTKFQPLMNEMQKVYEQTEDSTEIADLDAKWSACMADAGYTYAKQTEPQTEISDAMNKVYETFTEEDWKSGDPAKDNPEFKELGKKEIKVALDDLTCRDKFNYSQEKMKIQFAAEEQFVKDHKKELDEFKAAMEQSNK